MRFQGRFINEKGEEVSRWGDFASEDAFKEHLEQKKWRPIEYKEVGVEVPAFLRLSEGAARASSDNWWWPNLNTVEDAEKVIRQAMWLAFISSGIAVLMMAVNPLTIIDAL